MFNPGEDTTPSSPAFQHRRPTRKATDFINLEIFIRRVTIFAKKRGGEPKGIQQMVKGERKGPEIHSGKLVAVAIDLQGEERQGMQGQEFQNG